MIAVAQYSPTPREVERVSVIDVKKRPRVVADAWMAPDEIAKLGTMLGALRGESDAMYATKWDLIWTVDPMLCVWDRRRKLAWLERGRFHCKRDAVDVAEVRAVEAYVERGLVERGIRVALRSGQRWMIARQREWMAAIDPTYDHIDLFADASWVRSLGRALATALHAPLELSPAF